MSTSTLIQPEWVKMELCDMGKSIFNDLPLSQDRLDLKKLSIETSLALQDYQLLQSLTKTRDGLLNADLRRKVWPILLGFDKFDHGQGLQADRKQNDKLLENHREIDATLPTDATTSTASKLTKHKDEDQLKLDVDRSFVSWCNDVPDAHILELRSQLSSVVTQVLRRNPKLNYYQGYHDIGSIFLLVFKDETLLAKYLELFTLLHLRDFMLPQIDFSVDHLMLIPELICKIDGKFGKLIKNIKPFYSLASILTLFSHNLRKFDDICLVWDYILCENSMTFPIYLFATVLIIYKDEILGQLEELSGLKINGNVDTLEIESNLEDLKDFFHSILSNVIDKYLNDASSVSSSNKFFEFLQLTLGYLKKYPPQELAFYNDKISSNSVLKTSSAHKDNMTLQEMTERIAFYNRKKTLEIFDLQLEEAKKRQEEELRRLKELEKRRELENRPKAISKSKVTYQSIIANYWFNNKNKKITNRSKKFHISKFIFRLSFTIGILGVLIKYYNIPIAESGAVIKFQQFTTSLISGNGFNLTNLKQGIYR